MILTALDLVSLLPGFLREDVFSQAVCRALEPLLSQIVTDLDLLNTYIFAKHEIFKWWLCLHRG